MSITKFNVVVMAAQRAGVVNELAVEAGVSHKCLINMHGRKLIEHVLLSLSQSSRIDKITVSIDDVSVLEEVELYKELREAGRARAVEAGSNLFTSVQAAVDSEDKVPTIITTADNVLLTTDMIEHFCAELEASGAEAALGIAQKETILAKYPNGQKKFHKFADGEYANCNMYAVMTMDAVRAGKIFETGGQFAKSKERIFKAFGLWNAIAYKIALYTLDKGMERLGKRFGVKIAAIRMPFAEAPIDVDNPRTKAIANEILGERLAVQQ